MDKFEIKIFKEFIIFFFLLSFFIIANSDSDNFALKSSNITLKIKGKGNKKIFSNIHSLSCSPSFNRPDEVIINGNKQETVKYNYDFNETENEIILIWNEPATSCNCMFVQCKDIKEIDFSYFDMSQTTSMYAMF